MPGKRVRGPNRLRFLPGGIVELALNYGKVTLVDAADLPRVVGTTWRATSHHPKHSVHEVWYAKATGKHGPYMHVVLMGTRGVDHVNRDGLDNRRTNLRRATQQQNIANARRRLGRAGYRGVQPTRTPGKFTAFITVNYKNRCLGRFDTAEEAARAYDAAARAAFGEYATLNFPPPNVTTH